MPQNIFRLRLKMCFACGAPTKSQILFCLRRANKVSKFASPVARQHHKVSKFLLVRLTPAAHQKKPPDSVRLRRANKASNESLFRLRRTYKLHRTRTRILLRLRRANIASNTIVLRLRRANKEGLKICVACGAPTIPQKVVRFTCGANKGYQSNFGSVCLQRANTASKFGSDHLWRVNKASKYFVRLQRINKAPPLPLLLSSPFSFTLSLSNLS